MKIHQFGYVSNILSIARVLLVIPVYYFLNMQSATGNVFAVLVMCLAALTDLFDGMLARRLNQKSDLGRILDPVADKIAIAIVGFVLYKLRDLPLWFLGLAILRDVTIILLSFFLVARTRVMVESNMIGKITAGVLAFLLIVYTLDWQAAKLVALWASVAMIAISSASYLRKLAVLSRKKPDRSASLSKTSHEKKERVT